MDSKRDFWFMPIIKTNGFQCNLRCKYCYYEGEPRDQPVMQEEVLEILTKEAYRWNEEEVVFRWHGGEPLLSGKKFYQKAMELQKKYNQRRQITKNVIQTNGTLIDKEWAELFAKNKIHVGISLDGPEEYHNYCRAYPNGKGSFAKAMSGIEILNREKMPFGILCVVTKKSVKEPEKLFDFFIKNKICSIKFNPVRPVNTSYSPSWKEYERFLLQIIKYWITLDDPKITISPISEIFHSLLRGEGCQTCIFLGKCEHFWIITPNGDVYGCSSLGKEDQWKFGNIAEGTESIFVSPVFQEYQKRIEELRRKCSGCRWYNICKGGCMHDYHNQRNLSCQFFQRLFQECERILLTYRSNSSKDLTF